MHIEDDQVDPRGNGEDIEPGGDRPGMSHTGPPDAARIIRAGASFDASAAAELRREARALLARSADPLVVDLTTIRVAEAPEASAALRELAYEAGDADVDLRVVLDPTAPGMVRALLDDEDLFEIYPSLDAALTGTIDAPPPGERPGHPPVGRGD
jgi:hypothetical protein